MMRGGPSELSQQSLAAYWVWFALCLIAVLTVFVQFDALTRVTLSCPPFSFQPANATLLLHALKIALPSLGALGLAWLGLGGPIRRPIASKLAVLLNARWALVSLAILTAFLQVAWLSFYPTRPYADTQWYYDKAVDLASGGGCV